MRVPQEGIFRFRADVDVVPSKDARGRKVFVVRDPRSGRVFELEEPDYLICTEFDGISNLADVQRRSRDRLGHEVDMDDLLAFVGYLVQEGLLEHAGDASSESASSPARRHRDPIIRFGNPDKALRWCARRLRWCARWYCLVFSFVLVAAAAAVALLDLRSWLTGLDRYWHPGFPLFFLFTFVFVVTAVNELARGVALAFHGAHVSSFGLRFTLHVIPRFYTDATQFQLLREKEARLWVSFVAAFSVLVLWALSLIGWFVSQRGSYPNLAFWSTSLIAGFWGLLYVWNPLRRGDLQQLLASWLEVPRLQERAWNAAKGWFLGRPPSEPLSIRERRAFVLFGLASAIWIVVILGVLLVSLWGWLTGRYGGSGALLFAALLVAGLAQLSGTPSRKPKPLSDILARPKRPLRILTRWILRILVLGGIVWVLFLPIEYRVGGPVALRPVQRLSVTSEIDGIVGKVHVTEGSWVNAGDVVAELVSRDYDRDLAVAGAARREAEARLAMLLAGPKPEEVAHAIQRVKEAQVSVEYSEVRLMRVAELYRKGLMSEQEHDDARANRDLKKEELATAVAHLAVVQSGPRAEEIEAQREVVERLKGQEHYAKERLGETRLVSAIAGRVTTAHIDEQGGRRLEPGDELGVVEDSRVIEAEVLLLQDDVGLIGIGGHSDVRLWPFPESVFRGSVSRISPIATEEVDAETKVVSNRIRVVIEIRNPNGELKSGMSGYAKIKADTRPLWWVLARRVRDWLVLEFWSWLPA